MAAELQPDMLKRAKAYDREALAALYDAYHAPLYAYIYRQVGDVETARDLTADVFQRLLQALRDGGGPDRQVRPWLYRTAHNRVIDFYRRQTHRDHLPLFEGVVDGGLSPAATAEQRQETAQVRQLLCRLTPEQQQVIALKFLSGLSNAETAAVIGKPIGAVKALQHRALATLRRLLATEREVM